MLSGLCLSGEDDLVEIFKSVSVLAFAGRTGVSVGAATAASLVEMIVSIATFLV